MKCLHLTKCEIKLFGALATITAVERIFILFMDTALQFPLDFDVIYASKFKPTNMPNSSHSFTKDSETE